MDALGQHSHHSRLREECVLVGGGYECVLTHMSKGARVSAWTVWVVHTWHFPQSAHFNDFIDMNVFLPTDHILVSI